MKGRAMAAPWDFYPLGYTKCFLTTYLPGPAQNATVFILHN